MKEIFKGNDVLTWQQLLDEGIHILEEAGIEEARLDAWYLLEKAFQMNKVHFLMDRNREIFPDILKKGGPKYQEFLEKRAKRIPLQQILEVQEFMGLSFFVNEHVLIPRQDTETLVETVLKEHKETSCSVLDMCTGSGCIALSLALLGGYERITAVDVSLNALRVARKNVSSLFQVQRGILRSESKTLSENPWRWSNTVYLAPEGEEQKKVGLHSVKEGSKIRTRTFSLIESDLFANLDSRIQYDIIVSNPPYIPSDIVETLEPEVRDHEPRMALDGREDGLYFYRILAERCHEYLKDGGNIYFEIGYDQAEAVVMLLESAGYEEIEVVKDTPGLDRVVKAVWHFK